MIDAYICDCIGSEPSSRSVCFFCIPSGTFYLFASIDVPQVKLRCTCIRKELYSNSSCLLLFINDIPTIAASCNA